MSVGTVLAGARAEQGWSIEDVSAATRIRPHVIRAIEADDFAVCGGTVYARGHIRQLARQLGVDAVPLLREYDRLGRAGPAPLSAPALDPSLVIRERRTAPRWTTAMAVATGVVCCVAALRLVLPNGSSPPSAAHRKAPLGASTSPRSSTRVPATEPAPTTAPVTGVTLSLRVTGSRCWVSVKGSDGQSRLATVLTQGQTADFSDQKLLSVVLGDPGAVKLAVNGQKVHPRSHPGGVQRLELTADDPLAAFALSGASGLSN